MSLVELLAVIAVIAIICALIIPKIGNVSTQARYAKDQRNAQSVAGLLASARGAGATNSWGTVTDAIRDLEDGISVAGPSGSIKLKISPLTDDEQLGAADYLKLRDGMVYYVASQ